MKSAGSFNKVQKKVKIEPKGDKSKDAKGGRKFWGSGRSGLNMVLYP